MNMIGLRCPKCQTVSPADALYCSLCGEPIGKELVTELRGLAKVLGDLDARIADGKSAQTIVELRDEYAERYRRMRRVPPKEGKTAGALTRPLPGAQTGVFKKTLLTPATPAVPPAAPANLLPQAAARPPSAPLPAVPRAPLGSAASVLPRQPLGPSMPFMPTTPQASAAQTLPQPQRHTFSWRAFISDQAIAIMAYLGGFLALVATLTFVVSQGQSLPRLSLGVICAVYLAFGVAGLALRRSTDLRTVRRVYLGVFAFMTPLVMLAIYRFALKDFHVPVAAMLCISALYAAIVYLALTLETRFLTYAYLGWTSLIVSALAIVPWVNSALRKEVTLNWWGFVLGVLVLVLLAPRLLRGRVPGFDLLHEPATQLAVLATFPLVVAVQVFGAIGLNQTVDYSAFPNIYVDAAALALSACVQVPVTLAWRRAVPGWKPQWGQVVIDVIDGFNAVFFAEAVGGVALWIGANGDGMARVLAATALLEFGLAFWMSQRQPQRQALRGFLELLAVGLICGGAVVVMNDPVPNWPLITSMSAALIVTVGSALIDGPGWLLAGGFFLSVNYYELGLALLPRGFFLGHLSQFWMGLVLALWAVALWLGTRAETRRLVGPVYVVALANALYTLPMLLGQSPTYQVEVLLVFLAAAFSAGLRERQPKLANPVVGFFGLLVALPYLVENVHFFSGGSAPVIQDSSALHEVFLALGLAAAALAVRRLLGRPWAVTLYLVALWTVALAGVKSTSPYTLLPDWYALTGIPFMAWVLLFFSALAYVVSIWEKQVLATVVAGALAFWAIALVTSPTAGMLLIFGLIGAGVTLRAWRGPWWGVAWQLAAAVGVRLVVPRLEALPGGSWWQVGFLLAVALCAYLVAVQEEQPLVSGVAVLYAVIGAWFIQGSQQFALTVGLTFLLAAPGVLLRVPPFRGNVRREWAYAPYAAAMGVSFLACTRVLPFDANTLEALLLVFAAVAYVLVVLEGEPFGGIIPTLYAVASVFVQQDAHALLPLALSFALLALIAGRVAGARWSWPLYVAAVTASLATAFLGAKEPTFEAGALTLLALMTYVIAAVEAQPEVLGAALVLGVIALGTGVHALHLETPQATLAFAGLGWLYQFAKGLWVRLPWLHVTSLPWLDALDQSRQQHTRDPRKVGALVHLLAGLIVAGGTVLLALGAPGAFEIGGLQTLMICVALILLGGMLALVTRLPGLHVIWYLSGLLAALAVTWLLRYQGADNVQAYVVVPGSYLLIIGTFLPGDQRVPDPLALGKLTTIAGSLLLLVPTLYQCYTPEPNFTYELVLLFESLVILALGVGMRWRSLILTGSAFVGVAAISAVVLALNKGAPIPLVVGSVALVLIGVATWLSLRRRRTVGHAGE